MEKTKNKLSENQKLFFKNLSKYLNTKLYFYGSIQRFDFFKNKSDIDVCIFTDNMQTTKSKLASFLNISKKKFKKFIYNLHKTNKIVKGEKLEYTDEENIKQAIDLLPPKARKFIRKYIIDNFNKYGSKIKYTWVCKNEVSDPDSISKDAKKSCNKENEVHFRMTDLIFREILESIS